MVELFDFEIGRGTGFPYVNLEHGTLIPSTKLDTVLLNHIFNNLSYDPQCEGSRHDYLYEIVSVYPNRESIYGHVLQHFQEMTGSDYGELQVFGFVSRMVKDSHCSLESFVEKFESYWEIMSSARSIGIEEILDLERTDGIRRIARLFGRRISRHLEVEDLSAPFFEMYSDKFCFDNMQVMEQLRGDPDSMVSLYLNSLKVEAHEKKPTREFDFNTALNRVLSGERFSAPMIVKRANEEQFIRYCDAFINLKDKSIKSQMVHGFRIRKFVGTIDLLIAEFTRSRDMDYRISLLEAMIPFYDSKSRKLVEGLHDDKFRMVRTKVKLTQFNETDAWWILESFEIFSGDELHAEVGFFMRDEHISECSIFGKILEILLRRMHCSICRNWVVEKMIARKMLDRNQARLLMRDCHPETRKIAETYLLELTEHIA